MRRRTRLAAAVLLIAAAGAGPPAGVTVADLARAGRAAQARLLATGARWSATVAGPVAGPAVTADWVASTAGQRVTFTTAAAAVPLATVVVRDGAWYVTEGDRHVKCQPFAYPFARPDLMALYWLTLPRMTDRLAAGVTVDPPVGDRVVTRRPLPPATAESVDAILAQYDALRRADPVAFATVEA